MHPSLPLSSETEERETESDLRHCLKEQGLVDGPIECVKMSGSGTLIIVRLSR